MTSTSMPPSVGSNRKHGRNRQLVLEALEQAEKPMGAYELLEGLKPEGFRSPLQVYRALDQLIEDGIVHRIESLSAFSLCSHRECAGEGHMAFAICTNCGKADELHDPNLDRVLRRLARSSGFRANGATVELSGLCGTCSDA